MNRFQPQPSSKVQHSGIKYRIACEHEDKFVPLFGDAAKISRSNNDAPVFIREQGRERQVAGRR
jgi:hypothetical protein